MPSSLDLRITSLGRFPCLSDKSDPLATHSPGTLSASWHNSLHLPSVFSVREGVGPPLPCSQGTCTVVETLQVFVDRWALTNSASWRKKTVYCHLVTGLLLLLPCKRQQRGECSAQLAALLNDSVTLLSNSCSLNTSTVCVAIRRVLKGDLLGLCVLFLFLLCFFSL